MSQHIRYVDPALPPEFGVCQRPRSTRPGQRLMVLTNCGRPERVLDRAASEEQIKRDAFLEDPLIEAEIELLNDCRIGDAAPHEAIDVSTNSRSGEFDIATSALAVNGWCVVSNFFSQNQTQALAAECMAMYAAQLLTPARVGANRAATLLRGDSTRWFQPDALSPRQQAFADRIEALQNALNRDLFLGLVDSESHYAVYRPGTGYARHRDCLRNNDSRVISAVFYLNEAWQDAEGGALRLYLADQTYHDSFRAPERCFCFSRRNLNTRCCPRRAIA